MLSTLLATTTTDLNPLHQAEAVFDWILDLERWPVTHGLPILDVAYAVFACRNCRLQTQNKGIDIVQLYVSYLISTLGGSLLVSYLLSQPPGWLNLDTSFVVYSLVFVAFHTPALGDLLMQLTNNTLSKIILSIFVDITWMNSSTSYSYDAALNSPYSVKKSIIGPWLVSIASGLGGMITTQTFHLYDKHWSFSAPAIFNSNNYVFRLVVTACTTYALMTDHTKYLHGSSFTRKQARATVLVIYWLGDTFAQHILPLLRGAPKSASTKQQPAAVTTDGEPPVKARRKSTKKSN